MNQALVALGGWTFVFGFYGIDRLEYPRAHNIVTGIGILLVIAGVLGALAYGVPYTGDDV